VKVAGSFSYLPFFWHIDPFSVTLVCFSLNYLMPVLYTEVLLSVIFFAIFPVVEMPCCLRQIQQSSERAGTRQEAFCMGFNLIKNTEKTFLTVKKTLKIGCFRIS
jgi:hypothetical protein